MSASFIDLKDAGNALLKTGDLEGAVAKYTEALGAAGSDGEASAIALSNRSLALLRMGRATEALADAQRCVRDDARSAKGAYRVQKATEALEEPVEYASDGGTEYMAYPPNEGEEHKELVLKAVYDGLEDDVDVVAFLYPDGKVAKAPPSPRQVEDLPRPKLAHTEAPRAWGSSSDGE
jgi:tetratricopeptide (TPR) repeat protein